MSQRQGIRVVMFSKTGYYHAFKMEKKPLFFKQYLNLEENNVELPSNILTLFIVETYCNETSF